MLSPIERKHLLALCSRHSLDAQEIDSSLSYYENKAHLLALAHVVDLEGYAQAELDRIALSRHNGGALCPVCGERGSGPHAKWVLNARKKRYYPYFYFAHSFRALGKYRVKWHYVRKNSQTVGSTQ